jgi:DNA-binding NtrC family response regulator
VKKAGKILIVDDDEDILTAGKLLLQRHFSHVSTCNMPDHIPHFISDQHFDAILLDMNFGPGESSGAQGFYWLQKILEIKPESVIIMITAHGGVNVAVEANSVLRTLLANLGKMKRSLPPYQRLYY